MKRHLRLTFRLPASERHLEDPLTADLWAEGTAGLELVEEADERGGGRLRVDAWFGEDAFAAPEALQRLVARWRERGVQVAAPETVPEADWLALWREGARPIPVGERLLLDPREPRRAGEASGTSAAGRHLLRLPARRAFGTGSHETTRLALGLLESACFPAGRGEDQPCPVGSLLDVGTGTGVLAFAARRFGVPRVVAYDVDPLAVTLARDNAALNGFTPATAPRWWIGTAAALAPSALVPAARFEVVTLNVLPHLVDADLPRLARAVAPGGALLLAGPLVEESGAVVERLAGLGLEVVERRREGAWAGLRFEPTGDPEPPS